MPSRDSGVEGFGFVSVAGGFGAGLRMRTADLAATGSRCFDSDTSISSDAAQLNDGLPIGPISSSGLNRFPIPPIQSGDEQGREESLAHSGIASGDKEIPSHTNQLS